MVLSKMKMRKVGGKSRILPELVRLDGAHLWNRLLELMQVLWSQDEVEEDWKDAEVIPIPKKGDLQKYDNWWGISLLDVVGKVLARIIQERLQVIAERILPESQCDCRKGRGCCDMIFVARQLLEKSREHHESLFTLFVELRKAYVSMPTEALSKLLCKCGVLHLMLRMIQSFHEGMKAEVRLSNSLSGCFEVWNGLLQGCTLAPMMFNLYFSAVVTSWLRSFPEAGVEVLYSGRKQVGDRTAKTRFKCYASD